MNVCFVIRYRRSPQYDNSQVSVGMRCRPGKRRMSAPDKICRSIRHSRKAAKSRSPSPPLGPDCVNEGSLSGRRLGPANNRYVGAFSRGVDRRKAAAADHFTPFDRMHLNVRLRHKTGHWPVFEHLARSAEVLTIRLLEWQDRELPPV